MFGTISIVASPFLGNGGRNMLVAIVLAASLVSGDAVVNLLLGDSSIGVSNFIVVEGLGGVLEGSIIGVDLTATTYDVACATTSSIPFPFTTLDCVGANHVTITQGPSTMFLTQVFITANTSLNFRESCTFSNTETVTCSLINTVSEVLVVSGQTTTTSYTTTSSGVNAPPTNAPLYFAVTITAGLEKVNSSQATATPTPAITGASSSPTISPSTSTTTSRTSSGAEQAIVKGKWTLLSTFFIIIYLVQ